MDIRVKRTEKYFTKEMQGDLLTIDLIKEYLRMDKAFEPLDKFRFANNYETLSQKVYDSLKENPILISEVEKISKTIHIEEEYLTQISNMLPIDNDRRIRICTGITGFDCAGGAYGDTIYFGLEWFCKPDIVGISKDDYRYKYMASLNDQLEDFFVESIPHEMVHIISKKPDVDNHMFRMLEESRACYVTHLLFPEWSLYKVLPMENKDIDLIQRNEKKYMQTAYEMYLDDAENAIKMMFSPTGEVMNIGLSGYYIAYKLFEKKFSYEVDIMSRIKSIIEFTDCDELMSEFALSCSI